VSAGGYLRRVASRLRAQRIRGRAGDGTDQTAHTPEAPTPADGRPAQRRQWFFEHYEYAARETIDFLLEGGISLQGKVVADVGCGEGITDLGIVHEARPSRLVGFDINPTSGEHLLEEARSFGVAASLPPELEFVQSEPEHIPAADATFDLAITWSAFEHIANAQAVLKEIRRTVKPDGVLFLQLWPFYYSQHGSHLMQWFPEGFCQLRFSDDEIFERMRSDPDTDSGWIEMMIREYGGLNRTTLDELQQDLREAGFRIARVELMTHTVHLPEGVDDWPLTALSIAGVKLLASPTESRAGATRRAGRVFGRPSLP
jgi:ubiquinone/menaquinone biosynthesis C-methylase UbiE